MFQSVIDLLGRLMELCYSTSGSYGLAILIFTVAVKIVFLPLSVWQQKNSIKMVKIQPEVNQIKAQYINDSAKAGEEQLALYKRAGYRPLVGLIPTLIQIPLIIGVISVVYNPLHYLFHIPPTSIEVLHSSLGAFLGTDKLGLAWQIKAIRLLENGELTMTAASAGAPVETLLTALRGFDRTLLGCDLLQIPGFHGMILIYPVLAIVSTLLLCLLQNRANVLQREQKGFGRWGTSLIMILLAAYLSFTVPAAAVLYWTAGNILSIAVMYLMNAAINPHRYIDYPALEKSKKVLEEAQKNKKTRNELKQEAMRSKADYKRFLESAPIKKDIVFYSVRDGFYKYFSDTIEYILDNSDITIHYITSDAEDEVFTKTSGRFIPYYIAGNDLIVLFMKISAKIMVMTMPDLQQFYLKRSIVDKDIDYVYMFHYPLSTTMVLRKGALDYYDTIMCVGEFQFAEIRETEKLYDLPEKKLVASGYGFLEQLQKAFDSAGHREHEQQEILIAPSWNEGNILDSCIYDLLDSLLGKGFKVTVRPHPEYMRRYGSRMQEIINNYIEYKGDDLYFETDFSSSNSLFESDLVISDWSGAAYEFAFVTKRPVLLIDTPMKVNNPEYDRLPVEPLEITLRDQVGKRLTPSDAKNAFKIVCFLLTQKEAYKKIITEIRDRTIANFGNCGKVTGQYLLDELAKHRL